jgi:hypothetical protein
VDHDPPTPSRIATGPPNGSPSLTQPWPATTSEKAPRHPRPGDPYQYRHDRARRSRRGIDEQVAKAQRAVDGKAPVKRNRFIQLTGATKAVNRQLEAKTRALARWKGYTTNLTGQTPDFVIGAYHQLWRSEKAFRMSKHDLQARPIYHHTRDRSMLTSTSCSPLWPSATTSRPKPAGA